MQRACDSCAEFYTAVRSTSRFCSDTCRKRGQRGHIAAVPVTPDVPPVVTGTVAATRAELAAADRLGTYLGAAALALAVRIDESTAVMGFAALVKELRSTMVEALKGAPRAADAVDELEERRERKFAGA